MGSVSIRFANGFKLETNDYLFDITNTVSLADLMGAWCGQNAPEILGRLFKPETGEIAVSIMITLNGRSVKSDNPRMTMVSPGDSIFITPILVGG